MKEGFKQQPNRVCGGRFSRRTLIFSAVAVVVVLALAIGLGVGLTSGGGDDDDDDDDSSPQPTTTSIPRPTSTPIPKNGIWQPAVNSSWQIILQQPIELKADATSVTPDVDIFDIDLFTNENSTFDALHALNKKVICYFSAGSYEPDRPDSSQFKSADIGKGLDGWPGEKWLNISSPGVRSIMTARIELASGKGCDAIDPDNVDGYDNDNGLDLTSDDSIDFMMFLAENAFRYNMSIGLKNAGAIVPNLTSVLQFSVNEQCVQYEECDNFTPFIEAGKPVFHIEYPDGSPGNIKASVATKYCSDTGDGEGSEGFSTVLKEMDLNGWVQFCNGTTANTTLSTTDN